MNPYDFVPIDTEHPPERRNPVWHNVLAPNDAHPGKLHSGYLYLYIKAETPLFIRDASSPVQDPQYPGEHIRNKAGEQIIPGTSLKGLLRSVVETLCSGCMTVFHMPREYTQNPVPPGFAYCQNNTSLCIACRLFGMMQAGKRNAEVFLGKVNIGDAVVYEDSLRFYVPIYTAVLDTPKPRHRAFYLDLQGRYIAGRKFYFHHSDEPRTENRLIEIRNKPGGYRNQHIEPLNFGTEFSARIDFTNLEADEFAALMLAIALQPDMRHKIGYGKPIGLGSVRIDATELDLIDYSKRYTAFRSGRGMSKYGIDEITDLVNEHMASFNDPQVREHWQRFSAQPALQQLHRIWQWPPDKSVEYAYPSQGWFKANPQARIKDTRDLYPGD
jgi:CRISPR/Cas system CSM-associated protein Csm3 (group 7 of RAMP superfamily)